MARCLIIIDMQPEFSASANDWLHQSIILKIKEFRDKNEPIIVVEYLDKWLRNLYSSTWSIITNALEDYVNYRLICKNYNDGSSNIIECLNKEKWDPDSFQLCGVNLSSCVGETAKGLADFFPEKEVLVLEDCCNSKLDWNEAIFYFKNEYGDLDNVRLVMSKSEIATRNFEFYSLV